MGRCARCNCGVSFRLEFRTATDGICPYGKVTIKTTGGAVYYSGDVDAYGIFEMSIPAGDLPLGRVAISDVPRSKSREIIYAIPSSVHAIVQISNKNDSVLLPGEPLIRHRLEPLGYVTYETVPYPQASRCEVFYNGLSKGETSQGTGKNTIVLNYTGGLYWTLSRSGFASDLSLSTNVTGSGSTCVAVPTSVWEPSAGGAFEFSCGLHLIKE